MLILLTVTKIRNISYKEKFAQFGLCSLEQWPRISTTLDWLQNVQSNTTVAGEPFVMKCHQPEILMPIIPL